ncbi:hypothetical protein LC040_02590 [Bacillus tianshenii]|nr:hypothetical protein LC040_02590 [Bacillus tianshenii]
MDRREQESSLREGTKMSENMGLPTNTMGGTMSMAKDPIETNPHLFTESPQTEEKWESAEK